MLNSLRHFLTRRVTWSRLCGAQPHGRRDARPLAHEAAAGLGGSAGGRPQRLTRSGSVCCPFHQAQRSVALCGLYFAVLAGSQRVMRGTNLSRLECKGAPQVKSISKFVLRVRLMNFGGSYKSRFGARQGRHLGAIRALIKCPASPPALLPALIIFRSVAVPPKK